MPIVRPKNLAVTFLLCCSLAAFAQGQNNDLPKAAHAEDVGFSSERLGRITDFFQSRVDKGAIPGAVVLVARNGKVAYFQSVGYQDREKKLSMKNDAIFRIYSMTKPISSVAVMMLAEEGKLDLLAPVSQYLPEFKDMKVGVEKTDSSGQTTLELEPARRPILVQDLLRHTSGLVYGPFGHTLVHQAYNKVNLFDPGQSLAEFITKISKLPLAHQPGTTWEYSMSVDVLGRIVEVVSGMPFDRFIEERITKPLRMPDTNFYLTSSAQVSRFAEAQVDPATGQRPMFNSVEGLTKEKQKFFSGGGGLVSTTSDYARFCQMLVNGGQLDGVRLLAPKTIAMMTSDQLPPGTPRVSVVPIPDEMAPTAEFGQSFGLGFAVRTSLGPSPIPGSVGDYFWAGAAGTYFWIDPQEKVFAVMMLQMPFVEAGPYRRALREAVYGALMH
jgi:CubicO group peptidase (beta-lactamase class C family)